MSFVIYLMAMLIFGSNGLLVAHISLAPSHIVLLRTLIGGIFLTGIVMMRGGFAWKSVKKELLMMILGGSALGLNWIVLFEAYQLLNVSLSTLIYYIGPMIILLFSPILFKERLNRNKVVALCMVGFGLVCITGSIAFGGMNVAGLINALLSAMFYALLIIFNKRIVETSGLQTAAIELDVAFVVVLAYVLVTNVNLHIQAADVPYILVIGIVNTGLAYLFYFTGLQNLSAQSVALFSYVDPVAALFFSGMFLHEVMTPVQIVGAVLLLGGAIFGDLKK